MRSVFHQRLDALTDAVAEMCALAGQAMQGATEALLRADLVLAEDVISKQDKTMRVAAAGAERDAFSLLALRSPVASDLRAVVACLRNITDADRMGALALHVATIARRRHPAHALPEDVNAYFVEMGRIAVDLGRNGTVTLLGAGQARWENRWVSTASVS